jgi:hypothetical protein
MKKEGIQTRKRKPKAQPQMKPMGEQQRRMQIANDN